MFKDAPAVDMRFERGGWMKTEAEAKTRVVESYRELQDRALAAGTRIGAGRWHHLRTGILA
jgi:hypothetical protein